MTTMSTESNPTTGTLDDGRISELRSGFEANPKWKLAQNAVSQTTVDDVAMDRSIVAGLDYTFSTLLDATYSGVTVTQAAQPVERCPGSATASCPGRLASAQHTQTGGVVGRSSPTARMPFSPCQR